MAEALVIALRLVNGILTMGFLPLIWKSFKTTSKKFYEFWAIGFFLYGVHITVRAILPLLNITNIFPVEISSYIIQLAGFGLILIGIGELVNRTKDALLSFLTIPIILVTIYATTQPYLIGRIVSEAPYLFIAVALIIIRINYNVSLEMFIIGWINLLIANLGSALNYVDPIYLEVLAITSKLILLYGILYPKFTLLADDLRNFLISGSASSYSEGKMGQIILVKASGAAKAQEVNFINRLIREASPKGIRTILISMYDVLTVNDLQNVDKAENDIYGVRMIQGIRTHDTFGGKKVMTINDDPNDLVLLLSDIYNFIEERKVSCQIVFCSLSLLIHTHGWQRIYSILTSNLTHIKNGNLNLYLIYNPETHQGFEIGQFELLADKIENV